MAFVKIQPCFISEGDRKAYHENSKWTLKQNKDSIAHLRKENKVLRKKLSDCLAVCAIIFYVDHFPFHENLFSSTHVDLNFSHLRSDSSCV